MRYCLLLLALLSCLAGCRNDPYADAYIEALHAENRALEDIVYDLEYEFDKVVAELDKYREGDQTDDGKGTAERPSSRRSPENDSTDSILEGLDLSPPEIEAEPEAAGAQETGPGTGILPAPRTQSPLFPSDLPESPKKDASPDTGGENPLNAPQSKSSSRSSDRRVTQIHLDPERTGGKDFDGRPGDEGIEVVIEPRNIDGEFVPVTGPVAIVVLDPQEKGSAARVARWDFDAVQANVAIRNSSTERGIHLAVNSRTQQPRHCGLHLFVRYESIDGRRIEAEQEIQVQLHSELSARWTPRRKELRPSGQVAETPVHKPNPADSRPDRWKTFEVFADEPNWQRADQTNSQTLRIAAPLPSGNNDASAANRPEWRPYR